MVCQLNTWPRNPANNFALKKFLFGIDILVENTIKSRFTYMVKG